MNNDSIVGPWFESIPRVKWAVLEKSSHMPALEEPERHAELLTNCYRESRELLTQSVEAGPSPTMLGVTRARSICGKYSVVRKAAILELQCCLIFTRGVFTRVC